MTPLPKKKSTRSRSGARKVSLRLKLKSVQKCPSCGSLKEPHKTCPKCGSYK